MAKPKQDIAAGLNALGPARVNRSRMENLFGDRPEVKDAIMAAFRRGVSAREIARYLTANGDSICETTVREWCRQQGAAEYKARKAEG